MVPARPKHNPFQERITRPERIEENPRRFNATNNADRFALSEHDAGVAAVGGRSGKVGGTTTPDCEILIPKPDDPLLARIFRRLSYGVLALAFWLLILWMVRFIARSIFLLDLQAPRWLFSRSKLKPTLGDRIFLTRGSKNAGAFIDVARFSTFRFSALKKDDDLATELIALDAGVRDVLCVELNTTPIDGEAVMRELVFLERLMDLPNRTVIIDSTVSPLLIQTMASPEKPKGARLSPRQRWRTFSLDSSGSRKSNWSLFRKRQKPREWHRFAQPLVPVPPAVETDQAAFSRVDGSVLLDGR